MKKLWMMAALLLLLPLWVSADVTIFNFEDGNTLYADSLEANLNRLDDAIDLALPLASLTDSLSDRLTGWRSLDYASGFESSEYLSGGTDSLTISIVTASPIGNAQNLYVSNATGTVELKSYIIDFNLPTTRAVLDSLSIAIWTETTDANDNVMVAVYDDSLVAGHMNDFEASSLLTPTVKWSSVARTARTIEYGFDPGDDPVGGAVRIRLGLQMTNGDSMFVAPIYYHVTNP